MGVGGIADGACLDFSSYEWPISTLLILLPFALLVILLAVFVGVYAVRLSSDREPVEPVEPDLTKRGIAPSLCCSCSLPCFAKPEEYMHTW